MVQDDRQLFKPIKVGELELKHRIAMAPLTRFRAKKGHIPWEKAAEYYAQRASVPGTFLITEATLISEEAGGYPTVPGIFNDTHVKAWRNITDAVHEKGSFIYAQLWALGRTANKDALASLGHDLVSASDIPMDEKSPKPRSLSTEEVEAYVQQYATAAKFAIEAGFDGVEIHGANGYLIDQFTQDVSNKRTDKYGGSIENRSRFAIEVVRAVVDAVGANRTAIRLSPWSGFQGMRMEERTIPQFKHLVQNLPQDLAYLHLVESRIQGNVEQEDNEEESLKFATDIFKGPILLAGGFKPDSAIKTAAQDDRTIIVFGRYFISNPDLVAKVKLGKELTPYNRDTFYSQGEEGYTTYEVDEELVSKAA
jgi:NADPH2 dehydrogenase